MQWRVVRNEEGIAPLALVFIGAFALFMSLFVVVFIAVPAAVISTDPTQACVDGDPALAQQAGATPNQPPVVRGSGIRLQTQLTGPPTLYDWAKASLKSVAMGAQRPEADVSTDEHVVAMIAWAWAEGGGIKGHNGRFNPLNRRSPDRSLGGVSDGGRQTSDYPTFDAGVEVTARSIEGGYQKRIRAALLDRNTTADQVLFAIAHPNLYPGDKIWAEAPDYWPFLQRVLAGTRANFFARANEPLRARGEPPVVRTPTQLNVNSGTPQGGNAGQTGDAIPGFEGMRQEDVAAIAEECTKRGKVLAKFNGGGANAATAAGGQAPAGDGTAGWLAVKSAFKYLGYHYQWGGGRSGSPTNPNTAGMDCSGLMIVVFNDIGINISAMGGYVASTQARIGQRIGTNLRDARAGDMIIVNGGQHVGMFVKWEGSTPMWIESSGGSRCSGPSNWYSCKGVVYRPFWPKSIVSINRVICGVDGSGKPIVCGR